MQISAGSHSQGRRVPLHTVSIDMREVTSDGVTGKVGDTLSATVIDAWKPLTRSLSDPLVNRIARRGGWKIPLGYRTWVNAGVGAIHQLEKDSPPRS
ncbi:hypothetical protein [Mycobacterium vicinigordonae]|uniref:hypothetical protein n=1 Tax=Mycobacterium vicinigordonae TaxID=1719132 RepID=UPI001FE97205|nr:hypothetical protein [Mycobacterium vicinigordonae]